MPAFLAQLLPLLLGIGGSSVASIGGRALLGGLGKRGIGGALRKAAGKIPGAARLGSTGRSIAGAIPAPLRQPIPGILKDVGTTALFGFPGFLAGQKAGEFLIGGGQEPPFVPPGAESLSGPQLAGGPGGDLGSLLRQLEQELTLNDENQNPEVTTLLRDIFATGPEMRLI